jgi:hypothetical protein
LCSDDLIYTLHPHSHKPQRCQVHDTYHHTGAVFAAVRQGVVPRGHPSFWCPALCLWCLFNERTYLLLPLLVWLCSKIAFVPSEPLTLPTPCIVCALQGSNHLEEADRRPLALCPCDLLKLADTHAPLGGIDLVVSPLALMYDVPTSTQVRVEFYSRCEGVWGGDDTLFCRIGPFSPSHVVSRQLIVNLN